MTYEESLNQFNSTNPFKHGSDKQKEYFNMIRQALEKQIPMKPIHIHIEHDKHDWKKNSDGTIDEIAFQDEFHTGVVCKRCHESVCILCHEDYDDFAGKCIEDYHNCPSCYKAVRGNDMYCNNCGQALDWGD